MGNREWGNGEWGMTTKTNKQKPRNNNQPITDDPLPIPNYQLTINFR